MSNLGALAVHDTSSVLTVEERHVVITPVTTKEELEHFVLLPQKIYKDIYFWPGIDVKAELAFHDPEKNYSLSYLNVKLFLAVVNGEVVGRISAFVNRQHNKRWSEDVGFFGHFEAIEDHEVAQKLLEAAEVWVKSQGKTAMYGPFSYTYYDTIGVLTNAYTERPTIGLAYNPPYYTRLLEQAGYTKAKDTYEVLASVDDFYKVTRYRQSDLDTLINDEDYVIRKIDARRYKEDYLRVMDLYNLAFDNHWFAYALEEDEWVTLMEDYRYMMPDELCLIVEHKQNAIAFLFLLEDYYQQQLYQRHGIKGKINRVKAYIIGIKTEYQAFGIGKWLLTEIATRLKDQGYQEVSFSWIEENNQKSLRLATGMGGQIAKTFRVYQKNL